jgi:hypothetical protein
MNGLCLFFAGAGSISFRPEGEPFLSLIQVAQKVSTFVQAPEHHVKALQPMWRVRSGFSGNLQISHALEKECG